MKKAYKNLDKAEYQRLKDLFNSGWNNKKVIAITGRSSGTLYMIKKSTDYDNYKDLLWQKYIRTNKFQQYQSGATGVKTLNSHVVDKLPSVSKLELLEKALDNLKNLVSDVIVEEVDKRVEKKMKDIAVELNELRLLRDEAKKSNWRESLEKQLNR